MHHQEIYPCELENKEQFMYCLVYMPYVTILA